MTPIISDADRLIADLALVKKQVIAVRTEATALDFSDAQNVKKVFMDLQGLLFNEVVPSLEALASRQRDLREDLDEGQEGSIISPELGGIIMMAFKLAMDLCTEVSAQLSSIPDDLVRKKIAKRIAELQQTTEVAAIAVSEVIDAEGELEIEEEVDEEPEGDEEEETEDEDEDEETEDGSKKKPLPTAAKNEDSTEIAKEQTNV